MHTPPRLSDYTTKLNTPLLRLSNRDAWTLGDACEGTLIVGGTGSGKTSGSGSTIARAFLRSGFGGLVLCAKADECERWQEMAAAAGRAHHLLVIDEGEAERFNFLEYARAVSPEGVSVVAP